MSVAKRGDAVICNAGQHQGKRGFVVGLIGEGGNQMVEVNLVGEPQSTFHRPATLSRDYGQW